MILADLILCWRTFVGVVCFPDQSYMTSLFLLFVVIVIGFSYMLLRCFRIVCPSNPGQNSGDKKMTSKIWEESRAYRPCIQHPTVGISMENLRKNYMVLVSTKSLSFGLAPGCFLTCSNVFLDVLGLLWTRRTEKLKNIESVWKKKHVLRSSTILCDVFCLSFVFCSVFLRTGRSGHCICVFDPPKNPWSEIWSEKKCWLLTASGRLFEGFS